MRFAVFTLLAIAFSLGSTASLGQSRSDEIKRSLPKRLDGADLYSEDFIANHSLSERGGGNGKTLNLITLVADTCITITTKTKVTLKTGPFTNVDVNLNANTCVCIHGALKISAIPLGQLSLDGEVTGSGDLHFTGDLGAQLARKLFLDTLLGLKGGICLQASASLFGDSHSCNAYQPTPDFQGCCARKCNDGYTKGPNGNCIPVTPTCTPQQLLCGGSCYDKTQYTCNSGVPKPRIGARKRDTCSAGKTVCSVGKSGWECLDVQSNIESCGGCLYSQDGALSTGQDCTALPHIDEVTCLMGQCHIKSCQRGWELSSNSTECVPKYTSKMTFLGEPKVPGFHMQATSC